MNTIRNFAGLLTARERLGFIALTTIILGEAVLEMIGIVLIPGFITAIIYPDTLVSNVQKIPFASEEDLAAVDHRTLVLVTGLSVLTFFVFKAVYTVAATYWKSRYAFNRARKVSVRLFGAYMNAPYLFHVRHNAAELQRNVNQDCVQLATRALLPAVRLLGNTVIIAGIVCVLLVLLELETIAWIFLFIGTGIGFAAFLRGRARRLGLRLQRHRGAAIKAIVEGLQGVKEISILQRADFFVARLDSTLRSIFRIQRHLQTMKSATQPLIEVTGVLGLTGVTLMLLYRDVTTDHLVQTLSVFAVAFVRLKGAIRGAVDSYTEMRHSLPSVEIVARTLEELESRSMHEAPILGSEKPLLQSKIEFRNVSFTYPGGEAPALSNFQTTIERGESVALVGPTGSGKSTAINLLLGALEPSSGAILVDGQDIRTNLCRWRRSIGYVPQEVFLIDATIRENILLGLPSDEVDEHALDKAVDNAGLSSVIRNFPDGLETEVGERGTRLSGGERQRIVIARALYRSPEVLVLDEATSALDSDAESVVVRAVAELKGSVTIIMVTHRISSIQKSGRLIEIA